MEKRIVYQVEGQPLAILVPVAQDISILDTGKKDVPAGVPFWIVAAELIPADRVFRSAWELDLDYFGDPDGVGGTYGDMADD